MFSFPNNIGHDPVCRLRISLLPSDPIPISPPGSTGKSHPEPSRPFRGSQLGSGELRPTYQSSRDTGWARPPRLAPQPRRRLGAAAAGGGAVAAAAAGRPIAAPQRPGSRPPAVQLAAPCRPRPLQGPAPSTPGREFSCALGMFFQAGHRKPSSLWLLFAVDEKQEKAFLTPGNNSVRGGPCCRHRHHCHHHCRRWRGCCCCCHCAQSGRSQQRRGRQPSAGGPS